MRLIPAQEKDKNYNKKRHTKTHRENAMNEFEDEIIAHNAGPNAVVPENPGDDMSDADDVMDQDDDPGRDELELALLWIGFNDPLQRRALVDELGTLQSFGSFTEKGILAMIKDGVIYQGRTKVKFPMSKQTYLKMMIDWAKDRKKINAPITLVDAGLTSPKRFISAITEAGLRREFREKAKDAHDTQLKAASPGKLKDEKNWEDWLTGLQTTLTLIRGVTDVPLLYVIRDNEFPTPGEVYHTFDEECIAKSPLSGSAFDADAQSVHLIIKTLVLGEIAEQWVQSGFKKKNGRDDLAKLTAHYQGEGNSSRRIYIAENMWRTLHYKNERAMKFVNFISKAQLMLNIFYKNDEAKSMPAQVRWLLDQVKDPQLQATIAGLNIDVEKDPSHAIWDFSKCANHIASQVRKSSPEDAKGVSGVSSNGSGRKGKDGEVFTGTYTSAEWQGLSNDERTAVIKARGAKKGGNHKGPAASKQVKALTKQVKKQKKKIASLKKRGSPSASDDDGTDSDKDENPNAGTAFGGRAGKVAQKAKKVKING